MRAAIVVVLTWSSVATAQTEPTSPSPAPAPAPKKDWELDFGGRIFVRDTWSRVDIGGGDVARRHDRTIDQARLFLTYDRKRMRIAFEIEFGGGGGSELKDTYIRLRPIDPLRIQVGRFKTPMSFIGLESKWQLPSIERGLLSEFRQEDRPLPFVGSRADGIAVELRPEIPTDPRFTLAAFQNALAGAATPIDPTEELTQDLYARAEVEPVEDLHAALAFGLVGYAEELAVIESYGQFPLMSVEVFVDTSYLRVWAEGFLADSPLYQPDGSTSGLLAAARILVAGRFDRPLLRMHRIEPFVGVSVLDPTADIDEDRVSEVQGGANLAFSKHWRVQLEVAHRIAQGVASPVADSTLFRIQLGAAFDEKVR